MDCVGRFIIEVKLICHRPQQWLWFNLAFQWKSCLIFLFCGMKQINNKHRLNKGYIELVQRKTWGKCCFICILMCMQMNVISTHEVQHDALLTYAGNRGCTRDATEVNTQTHTHTGFPPWYLWLFQTLAPWHNAFLPHYTWQHSVDFLQSEDFGWRKTWSELSCGRMLSTNWTSAERLLTVTAEPVSDNK